MKIRWIRRYKVSCSGSEDANPKYYLNSDLVLQEMVKVRREGTKFLRDEWRDLEVFDDLESKERAHEELQKKGVFTVLKIKE